MTIKEAVTKRILELCTQRGITVNKLAVMSGITQSTLGNIVGGEKQQHHGIDGAENLRRA